MEETKWHDFRCIMLNLAMIRSGNGVSEVAIRIWIQTVERQHGSPRKAFHKRILLAVWVGIEERVTFERCLNDREK